MSEEYISADKLYKIIHCSKRKTKYLLDNGIIPCEDTGKKTWRYQVKLSDVAVYLENVDVYEIPVGIFSSHGTSGEYKSLSPYTLKKRKLLIPEICQRLKTCPDALTIKQAADATMLSVCALKKAVKKGTLLGIQVMQVTYIPKDYLRTYVKARLENMRIPLCKRQIDFIDSLTRGG